MSDLRLRPRPQVSGYFVIRDFFFPDSSISPYTRYRICCGFMIFHSGERILKYPEAVFEKLRIQKYPDTCGRGLRGKILSMSAFNL